MTTAEIELVIRAPEAASKHAIGSLSGLRPNDLHLDKDRRMREQVARMLVDWACRFGGLDVTVHGPVEAETEEL